jgi:hypothetical protein
LVNDVKVIRKNVLLKFSDFFVSLVKN